MRQADVIGPDLTALLDELAALTADPDASLAELRARYAADERLRVPAVVRNAIRGTTELGLAAAAASTTSGRV